MKLSKFDQFNHLSILAVSIKSYFEENKDEIKHNFYEYKGEIVDNCFHRLFTTIGDLELEFEETKMELLELVEDEETGEIEEENEEIIKMIFKEMSILEKFLDDIDLNTFEDLTNFINGAVEKCYDLGEKTFPDFIEV